MFRRALNTVVETPVFLDAAKKLLGESERMDLIAFLAANPTAGDLIPATGGVRKLRWALEGRGKRGGARVIYFFHNQTIPLFLLTVYAKNQQENLSAQDCNQLQQLTRQIVTDFGNRRTTQ